MSSQWVGIAISIVVVLGGTAVNLFIIGRFVGQWSEALRNLAATLGKVETQLETTSTQAEVTEQKAALIDQRLAAVEVATSKFWEMRDAFTRMSVTLELTAKGTTERLESLGRSVGVIERQMANLVTTKAGFTTLEDAGKGAR